MVPIKIPLSTVRSDADKKADGFYDAAMNLGRVEEGMLVADLLAYKKLVSAFPAADPAQQSVRSAGQPACGCDCTGSNVPPELVEQYLKEFLSDEPCGWDGCEELRASFASEMPSTGCTGCKRASLIRKYRHKIKCLLADRMARYAAQDLP